jgi:hypothetical protein
MRRFPLLFSGFLFLLVSLAALAQDSAPVPSDVQTQWTDGSLSSSTLPDAPVVQGDVLSAMQQQTPNGQTQSGSGQDAGQPTSSSQAPTAQSDTQKSQYEKAEEQLKQQERQRVAGVMATFNTTTNRDAVPLSPGQKFRLFFRSSIDPWPFFLAGVVAGIGQASDSNPEWGQGMEGYAKRFGASYSDAFIGNFFGNAVLPIMLKEDPRYFQKGTGSATSRFLWAAGSTVWCRRDNGKWGPNYSNVAGNLIGAAISRAYYPPSQRTVSDTITDGLTVSVEGIVGAEVIEFWPDLARHYQRKHAEKLAREAAESNGKNATPATNQQAPTGNSEKPQN